MIRKHFISLSVVLLLSAVFVGGHKTSADIYHPWLACATQLGGGGIWDSNVGTCYPIAYDANGCYTDPHYTLFLNSDGNYSYHSDNAGSIYGLTLMTAQSCPSGQTGNIVYLTSQDVGPSNFSSLNDNFTCVKTDPYYVGDNCTNIPPATLSVVKDSSVPVGGTWAFSPGGYNGPTMTINVDPAGTLVGLTFNTPSGYACTVNGSPNTWTTDVFPGDNIVYNVSCTPIHQSPTVTLTPASNPDQCSTGTTILWSSTNATSCSATWTSSTATSGSQAVKPSSSPQTYSMTCTNGIETGSNSASITSSDAVNGSCTTNNNNGTPTVNLTANPSTITAGHSSTLTWSSSGGIAANSCSTYWTSQTGSSGSQSVSPVSTTSYSIVCHDSNNQPVYGTTQVNVTPTSAVIFIYSNIDQGGGTVNPGGLSGRGTGLSSYGYVTPDPTNGTTYTITPYTVPGYTYDHVADGQGGSDGASALLFPGGSKFFEVEYTQTQPAFTYTLSNSGPNSVTAGAQTQEVITETLTSGTGGPVSLTVSGLPSGATISGISGQGCTPNCTSTITINVGSGVSQGNYPITVTGDSNSVTTQFNMNVNSSSNISVNCVPSPAVAKVGQSVTWTATASGGTPPYTYSWSGSGIPTVPNVPTSNPYSLTYSTVGSKTATATVNDSKNKSASCQAGTAIVNISPTFQEF